LPAFFSLKKGPLTITEIAEYIGHSQPSATKTIKEMMKAGLCENLKTEDKRRNLVGLTDKGKALSPASGSVCRYRCSCGKYD
jgi:DNA-binding MarR family transcriptional regulator